MRDRPKRHKFEEWRKRNTMPISTEERATILRNMKTLLDEYDYTHTDYALESIIDEWATQKSTLIEAFKKHPKYIDGKFLIAFDTDYDRPIKPNDVAHFSEYIANVIPWCKHNSVPLPTEVESARVEAHCCYLPPKMYDFLTCGMRHFTDRVLTEEQAKEINEAFPTINAKVGQKTSRVVNKICTYLHYDKHDTYNREFARYADALSPMTIKRHTILSINPIDYLTMSFGNSWASCHTIDKANKRKMPNSYSGMYSSGTMSYMLDGASMVLYVVDKSYDGDEYYFQPKVNRQMFHWGHDKLIQARLYPQDCDGDNAEYTTYRNIVQEIMSVIFDFPNLWKVNTSICGNVVSYGTHYRDYEHFPSCRLSIRQGSTNTERVEIGASPICIECGEIHDIDSNINCCQGYKICADCGCRVNEDDAYYIDGEWYCDSCTEYCNECDERVHHTTNVDSSGWGHYVCDHCLEEYFTQCEECDEYVRNEDVYWHDGHAYCEDCYDRALEEEQEENERESEEEEA